MNSLFPKLAVLTAAMMFFAPTPSIAAMGDAEPENTDYVSYDSIVENLQKETAKQDASSTARSSNRKSWFSSSSSADPFENVWIHAGIGFAQSTQNLTLPNGAETVMAGRGIQAAVGIDILGPNLSAEGAMRSFGETEDASSKISLKEFDLKILFKSRASRFGVRAGGGLSARYMTAHTLTNTYEVTTPASVVTLGGDIYLSPGVSLGLDLSTRNAMVAETFDRSSIDGTLRLDTHF